MTAYEQVRVGVKQGAYPRFCGLSGCHKPAKRRELIMGRPTTMLCDPHAKVAREAWASGLETCAARCNSCEDGRLLPGARGAVVPVVTCCDCLRSVPLTAMQAAA